MALIEDSRVKIPANLHVTMLGYTYLSLKGSRWDEANHILLDLFHSSVAAKPSAPGACSWPESVVRSKVVARDGKNQHPQRKRRGHRQGLPLILQRVTSDPRHHGAMDRGSEVDPVPHPITPPRTRWEMAPQPAN